MKFFAKDLSVSLEAIVNHSDEASSCISEVDLASYKLEDARTEVLYRLAKTSVLGSWLTAILAVFLLWSPITRLFMTCWCAAYSLLALLRLFVCFRYGKGAEARGHQGVWRTYFVCLAGLSGILWGILVFNLFPHVTLESKVIIIFFAGGLTASAVAAYAAVLAASMSFCIPFLASLILMGPLYQTAFTTTISSMTILYTLFLYLTARTMHASVVRAIRLQFENLDLIDSLRESQLEQQKLNQQLRSEITSRTTVQADLEQTMQTLQEAKDEAEKANSAKGRFLAVISHEIRTPLNNIIMACERLEDQSLDQGSHRYVSIVAGAAKNLLTLFNDILDHAKIGSGQIQLEFITLNLLEFIKKTCRPFEIAAQRKGLDFIFESALDVPTTVTLDPFRLRQILTNLLDNAIKFTANGSVILSVQHFTDSSGHLTLHFIITDTGIGIPSEMCESLFEPFVQGDVSTTRLFGGTGLGLAICREIVTLMGGSICCSSRERQGSVFSFVVPVEQPSDSEISQGLAIQNNGMSRSCKSLKILLAEDDEISTTLTKETLASHGHTVVSAMDGEQALALALSERFDLLLLDMEMPKKDGFLVLQILRKHEKEHGTMHLPVAAVTAQAFPEDYQRCILAGADGYLAKPVSQEKLLQLIREVLPYEKSELKVIQQYQSHFFESRVLKQRVKGQQEVLKKMVSIFLATYPELCQQIHDAILEQDRRKIRLLAHKLKGMLAYFDDSLLVEKAQKIEVGACDGDFLWLSHEWENFQKEAESLCMDASLFIKE